ARIERHRHQRGFAVSRQSLDGDAFGIDLRLPREQVERPACPPRPGAKRTPVVQPAWLALRSYADHPLPESGAVVGLDRVRDDDCIGPAAPKHLRSPWIGWRRHSREVEPLWEAELEDERHVMSALGQRLAEIYGEGASFGRSAILALDHSNTALLEALFGNELPVDPRRGGRDTAIDFVLEQRDQLRSQDFPPPFRPRIRDVDDRWRRRARASLRFIVIDVVGALLVVAVGAGPHARDLEPRQRLLIILLRGGPPFGRSVELRGEGSSGKKRSAQDGKTPHQLNMVPSSRRFTGR